MANVLQLATCIGLESRWAQLCQFCIDVPMLELLRAICYVNA